MSSVDTSDSYDLQDRLSSARFPVLDTLRAVGALAVLMTHTAFWAGAYTQHGPIGPLLARLDVGVAIFFVLSGFLLSRPWLIAAASGRQGPGVGRYLWKRALRILPVYLVTAVIALVFIHENRDLGPMDWLVTLSLTDIYVHPRLPAGLTQMWSLATELAFYVALPGILWVALGRRRGLQSARIVATLVAMACLAMLWLGFLGAQVPGADEVPVNEWLPAFLSWFAVGIGLALLHTRHHGGPPEGGRWRGAVTTLAGAPGVCWTLALALMLVASTPLGGPTLLVAPSGSEAITKNLLYAAIGGLLVFSGVFAESGSGYHRLMSHRWARHLGHISYGIFCIHLPILHLVMWMTGYELFQGHLVQIFLLTLTLSVVAAEILYRVVELPSMRLRNLGRSRSPAATVTTADTDTSTR